MTPLEVNLSPICIFCGPTCKVGYGYCHCECGGKTKPCTMTSRKFGVIAGKPCRYILGHQGRVIPVLTDEPPFLDEHGVPCRYIPLTRGQRAIVWASDYVWLMRWKWMAIWDEKGQCFYAVRHGERVKGQGEILRMHRVILNLPSIKKDARQGDHKNGNTLDNRRSNLRQASQTQNAQNMTTPITNKSGFKGVCFHKATGRWTAQINVNGKKMYLGLHDTPELGHVAYREAAIKYHGEFARFE